MIVYDKLYIGGRWVAPAVPEPLEIRSPHDRTLLGRAVQATPTDVDRAVSEARVAFDVGPWPNTTPEERQRVIERMNAARSARAEEIVGERGERSTALVHRLGATGPYQAGRRVCPRRALIRVGRAAGPNGCGQGCGAPRASRRRPTLFADVDNKMRIAQEEIFGPVLVVIPYQDEDEAVRLANDSPYGLGASVFSRNTARGEAIARRVEAGAANVNDAMINYTVLELPMGGAKASGLGSRHGPGGIRKYCSQQAIVITPKLALKKEPFMYPYKSRTSRLLAGLFKLMYGRGKRD